ncbi:MAG: hypothetical protein U0R52_04900 [Solirubrobacterales bacterium]
MRPSRDRLNRVLAPATFGLLVLATVAAFAYAQRLKREPLILDKVTFGRVVVGPAGKPRRLTAFSPNGDCRADHIRIRFRVTRSDRADVEVIDTEGRLVRTLAEDRFLKRYRFHTFYWGGGTRRGTPAPPGRYKLRVVLLGQDRTLVPGGAMRLHRVEPRGRSACRRGPGDGTQ